MALEAGFDLVGIATADPLPEAERATLEWLRAGMAAGMRWITDERTELSCDPSRLLSGARSALVLGKYYLPPEDELPAAGPGGRIARYARGDDYHEVIRPRLARIVDHLGAEMGRRPAARLFVDSSPLAEKAVAARSGLGWFGKNSCTLTLHHGSWILLSVLLTDLELEPDPPLQRDCGRCRLCIEHCPTGALVAPYVLDSRRCLAYLTIEHRGALPRGLRPAMGAWIFGCDVCQEVCPYNRLTTPTADPAFSPRQAVGSAPALAPLMELDESGFRRLFRGSPVLRARRRGLLRNAAVALGNARDPSALPALARALSDVEPLIRGHAAWALGRIGGAAARSALARTLLAEPDEQVREEIGAALDEAN